MIKKKKFACTHCKILYVWSDLKVHLKEKACRLVKCHRCQLYFRGCKGVQRHQAKGNCRLKCIYCGKCFVTAYQLTLHRNIHLAKRRVKCHICHMSLRNLYGLKRHFSTFHDPDRNTNRELRDLVTCDLCNTVTRKICAYKHFATCHTHLCLGYFDSKYKPNDTVKCSICHTDVLVTTYCLHRHMELAKARSMKFSVKLEKCIKCNLHFSANALKCHDVVHKEKNELLGSKLQHLPKQDDFVSSCVFCNLHFRSYEELEDHTLMHTEEMPFQCKLCDVWFNSEKVLSEHIHRNHNKSEKNDQIIGSEKNFSTQEFLPILGEDRRIYAKVRKIKRAFFYCAPCDEFCASVKSLSNHYLKDRHITKVQEKYPDGERQIIPEKDDTIKKLCNVKYYFCDYCTYSTNELARIKAHILTEMHKKKVASLQIKNGAEILSKENIESSSPGSLGYTCGSCNLTFDDPTKFIAHCKSQEHLLASGGIFLPNDDVDAGDSFIRVLTGRMETKTYICEICDQKFSSKGVLRKHYVFKTHLNNWTEKYPNKEIPKVPEKDVFITEVGPTKFYFCLLCNCIIKCSLPAHLITKSHRRKITSSHAKNDSGKKTIPQEDVYQISESNQISMDRLVNHSSCSNTLSDQKNAAFRINDNAENKSKLAENSSVYKMRFTCESCKLTFDDPKQIMAHFKSNEHSVTTGEKLLPNDDDDDGSSFIRVITGEIEAKRYLCETCGVKCIRNDYLKSHYKSKKHLQIWAAKYPNEEKPCVPETDVFITQPRKIKFFSCLLCDIVKRERRFLVVHLSTEMHKKNVAYCEFKNSAEKTSRDIGNIASTVPHIGFTCDFCESTHDDPKLFMTHCKSDEHLVASGGKLLPCDNDDVGSSFKGSITGMFQTRLYLCETCDKKYQNKNSLKVHYNSQIHLQAWTAMYPNGEKPLVPEEDVLITEVKSGKFYCCLICNYFIKDEGWFDEHLLSENHNNNFTSSQFGRSEKTYEKSICPKMKFACETCNLSVDNPKSFIAHCKSELHLLATRGKILSSDIEYAGSSFTRVITGVGEAKRYLCETCGTKLLQNTFLKKHYTSNLHFKNWTAKYPNKEIPLVPEKDVVVKEMIPTKFFYCVLCDIVKKDQKCFDAHLSTEMHQKNVNCNKMRDVNENMSKELDVVPKIGFYCDSCDVRVEDPTQFMDHCKSNEHLVATGGKFLPSDDDGIKNTGVFIGMVENRFPWCESCNSILTRRNHLKTHYTTTLHMKNWRAKYPNKEMPLVPKKDDFITEIGPTKFYYCLLCNYVSRCSLEGHLTSKSHHRNIKRSTSANLKSSDQRAVMRGTEANYIARNSTKNEGTRQWKTSLNHKIAKCRICDRYFGSKSFEKHQRSCFKKQFKIKCEICKKVFRKESAYKAHFEYCQYKCPTCGYLNFRSKKSFQRHLLLHTVSPVHECVHCNQVFLDKYSLFKHRKCFCPKRVFFYKCNICCSKGGFQSSDPVDTLNHVMKCAPLSKTRVKCFICTRERVWKDFRLHFQAELLTSSLIDKNTLAFECEDRRCLLKFPTEQLLKVHQEEFHTNKTVDLIIQTVPVFPCCSCGANYSNRNEIITHIRDCHELEISEESKEMAEQTAMENFSKPPLIIKGIYPDQRCYICLLAIHGLIGARIHIRVCQKQFGVEKVEDHKAEKLPFLTRKLRFLILQSVKSKLGSKNTISDVGSPVEIRKIAREIGQKKQDVARWLGLPNMRVNP